MTFTEDEITMLRLALLNSEPMDDSEEAARGALLQKLWDGRIALRKAKRDAEDGFARHPLCALFFPTMKV